MSQVVLGEKINKVLNQSRKLCDAANTSIVGRDHFSPPNKSTNWKYFIDKQTEYIERWKKGLETGNKGEFYISNYVRRYLFNKYNSKCAKCGWGEINQFHGKIPLTVSHKDNNYKNSVEDNLELLCPNCHSLTEFYGARNKGNGRKYENRRRTAY